MCNSRAFHRSDSTYYSNCDRENVPIRYSPFRWVTICRVASPIRWMSADPVNRLPSSNTWCCRAHGDNGLVFLIDNHLVPNADNAFCLFLYYGLVVRCSVSPFVVVAISDAMGWTDLMHVCYVASSGMNTEWDSDVNQQIKNTEIEKEKDKCVRCIE